MSDRTQSYAQRQQDQRDEVATIVATLDRPDLVSKYSDILPSNVSWADFRNAFLVAVQMNPKLLMADRQSLWLSLQKAASDGLKPDGREGALVIFGDDQEDDDGNIVPSTSKGPKKVVWMPMVWGLTKQMRNTGNVASVRCKVIYKGESITVTDKDGKETYEHVRTIDAAHQIDEDPAEVIGAYSVVQYKDGFWDAEFMTRRQIDRVRATSKAKSAAAPWSRFFHQMAMKCPLRRLSLRVEKSKENERYFKAIQDDATMTIEGDKPEEIMGEFSSEKQAEKIETKKPAAGKVRAAAESVDSKRAAGGGGGAAGGNGVDGSAGTMMGGGGGSQPVAGAAGGGGGSHTSAARDYEENKKALASEPERASSASPRESDTHVLPSGSGPESEGASRDGEPEIWAVDDNGEPIDRPEPMTPVEFAQWFAAALVKSKGANLQPLQEHNADSIGEAGKVMIARTIISDAIAMHTKKETPAATAEPVNKRTAMIPIPKTKGGKEHLPNYMAAVQDAISKLTTVQECDEWEANNRPVFKNRASEIPFTNRLNQRRLEIKPVVDWGDAPSPPGPDPEPKRSPTAVAQAGPEPAATGERPLSDNEIIAKIMVEVADMKSEDQITQWSLGPIRPLMMKLKQWNQPAFMQACAIIDERRAQVEVPS